MNTALATSRYQASTEVGASGLCPVGITVSPPRYRLRYELAGSLGALAPYGILGLEDPDRFRALYVERLERFGAERIAGALTAIAELHDAPGCVLLCYEDLTKPGEWCHRRLFAHWYEQQTGQAVPEL